MIEKEKRKTSKREKETERLGEGAIVNLQQKNRQKNKGLSCIFFVGLKLY